MNDADLVARQVVQQVRGDVVVYERGEQCALLGALGEGGIGKETDGGAGLLGQIYDALVGLGASPGPQQLGSASVVWRQVDQRRLSSSERSACRLRACRS